MSFAMCGECPHATPSKIPGRGLTFMCCYSLTHIRANGAVVLELELGKPKQSVHCAMVAPVAVSGELAEDGELTVASNLAVQS